MTRKQMELALMEYLNSAGLFGLNEVFDCGELGLLHTGRNNCGQWDLKWFTSKPLPAEVLEKMNGYKES